MTTTGHYVSTIPYKGIVKMQPKSSAVIKMADLGSAVILLEQDGRYTLYLAITRSPILLIAQRQDELREH